ncbi:hypothetical protein FACS189449_04110 [Alphaproteobacteria bacterium]|nr:hypothetical protein FACS189449_04110 [Alphaproteobacteria bacterium]
MLEFIRKYSSSPVVKFFLFILAFTFVFCFGIMDIVRKYMGKDYLVKIGSVKITPALFKFEKDKKLNMLRNSEKNIDEKAETLNILDQIILENVIDLAASDFGFVVSEKTIEEYIKGLYVFRDDNGRFDKNRYNMVLQKMGMSEKMFIELSKKDIKNALIAAPFRFISTVSELGYYTKAMLEKRTLSLVELKPLSFVVAEKPSDANLQEFYTEHPDLFSVEERRSFRILELCESDLAKDLQISEENKKDYYDTEYVDKDSKSYEEAEKEIAAELLQEKLLKVTEDRTRDIEDALSSGTSIEKVAKNFNLKVIPVSDVDISDELQDSQVSYKKDAITVAFTTDEGTDSSFSESANEQGEKFFWLVHTDSVDPKHVEEFAKVSEKVKSEWIKSKQKELANAMAESLVEQVKSGANLANVASERGYTSVITKKFDREGNIDDGKDYKFSNAILSLYNEAFQKLKNEAGYNEVDGNVVVYQVNGLFYADNVDPKKEAELHGRLIHEFADGMLQEAVGSLSKKYKVEKNYENLNNEATGIDLGQFEGMF